MLSQESFGKFHAGLIRERLLADYVDIWENIFESDGYVEWASNNSVSKLYIHAAPQCGKVSITSEGRLRSMLTPGRQHSQRL